MSQELNIKKPLVILTGPTASGKTELSVMLAKRIGGEIISADSMQVYRHMDIGSAKAAPAEMDGVPHHLIDVMEPWEEFNVTLFQKLAKEAAEQIYAKGRIPIVAGGTGFYIQALLYDVDFTENDGDMEYRNRLAQLSKEQGPSVLHEMLAKVDPESAAAIHENNIKRVIRALEFYQKTGQKISAHNEAERKKESPYRFAYYVLNMDRERLYRRIDLRVDRMMEAGLEDEDLVFIKKFVLASGSLKEMAGEYGVTYPTVRLRLDRLIQKIKLSEDTAADPYIGLIKRLTVNEKLDFDTAKVLISAYKKAKEEL